MVAVRIRSESGSGGGSWLEFWPGILGCFIGKVVAEYVLVCWDPSDLDLPASPSELVKCLYGCD